MEASLEAVVVPEFPTWAKTTSASFLLFLQLLVARCWLEAVVASLQWFAIFGNSKLSYLLYIEELWLIICSQSRSLTRQYWEHRRAFWITSLMLSWCSDELQHKQSYTGLDYQGLIVRNTMFKNMSLSLTSYNTPLTSFNWLQKERPVLALNSLWFYHLNSHIQITPPFPLICCSQEALVSDL